ncbi:unnamed protein product [Aphanomyces euteiches]
MATSTQATQELSALFERNDIETSIGGVHIKHLITKVVVEGMNNHRCCTYMYRWAFKYVVTPTKEQFFLEKLARFRVSGLEDLAAMLILREGDVPEKFSSATVKQMA